MKVNITRVNIEIANPVLFDLLKKHEDIIHAERHLQKHEKWPSCRISIKKIRIISAKKTRRFCYTLIFRM